MTGLCLREVVDDDLPLFFDVQLDPDANYMAAFTHKDPTDREAFTAHWNKIMADPTTINRTIVCDGQVVGSVSSYEVWQTRSHLLDWQSLLGQGHRHAGAHSISDASQYHATHLRPRRSRFQVIGETKGFANARGREIEELLLELPANDLANAVTATDFQVMATTTGSSQRDSARTAVPAASPSGDLSTSWGDVS